MNQESERILNCLSVDVEGFVESNSQSFDIGKKYINKAEENREIEKNVHFTLGLLSDLHISATFFILGRISKDIPQVVREIAQQGHEIACHSYEHLRIFQGISKDEFREKLFAAKSRLEEVSGKKVCGFRAPDFSITKASIWALDVLKELGFIYDSSIYPIGFHDVYGVQDASPLIHKLPNGLIEFPLSSAKIFGKRFPFGGGGYFRIYPLFITKYFLSQANRMGQSCMFYIHPYEVGPSIPKIDEISFYRKFRHYHNTGNGGQRLKKFVQLYRFVPAIEILKQKNII